MSSQTCQIMCLYYIVEIIHYYLRKDNSTAGEATKTVGGLSKALENETYTVNLDPVSKLLQSPPSMRQQVGSQYNFIDLLSPI